MNMPWTMCFNVFFQTIRHTSLSSSAYFDHFSSCSCHFSWAVKRHNSTRCDIRKCEKQIWQWVKADGFVMICPQGGFAPNLSHCWRGKWSLEHLQTQICGVAGKILHAQHEHAGISRGRPEDTAAMLSQEMYRIGVVSTLLLEEELRFSNSNQQWNIMEYPYLSTRSVMQKRDGFNATFW